MSIGFFDYESIWRSSKRKLSVLDFFVRDSNQGKVTFKAATAAWLWLQKLSQPQISLDLPWVGFGVFGDGMGTSEIIQNERLNED